MYKLNKILKVFTIVSLLTVSQPYNAFAENADEINEAEQKDLIQNYKGLGITAGYLSGLGFTYRQYFADRFGVKVTGLGFFDQYQSFGNIGLQGMYVFSENDWLRFYGLAGVSNFTFKRRDYSYPTSPDPSSEYVYIPPRGSSNYDMYNSFGAGIGIELGRQEQGLSFAIELPIVATFKGTNLNSFYPIPSLSVIYNF